MEFTKKTIRKWEKHFEKKMTTINDLPEKELEHLNQGDLIITCTRPEDIK